MRYPAKLPFLSLITPGGIATSTSSCPCPGRRPGRSSPLEGSQLRAGLGLAGPRGSRSSPLEGSQPEVQHALTGFGQSLITPGGIATRRRLPGFRHGPPVAHHPWRDRNPCSARVSKSGPASLITPGGIATPRHGRRPAGRARRSSPLEGSQHVALHRLGRHRAESLITPGGIATRPSPAAGPPRPRVAHHPWRDRNTVPRAGRRGRCWGRSSPLEGSQLQLDGIDALVVVQVAHHPWRDRNMVRIIR